MNGEENTKEQKWGPSEATKNWYRAKREPSEASTERSEYRAKVSAQASVSLFLIQSINIHSNSSPPFFSLSKTNPYKTPNIFSYNSMTGLPRLTSSISSLYSRKVLRGTTVEKSDCMITCGAAGGLEHLAFLLGEKNRTNNTRPKTRGTRNENTHRSERP